MMDSNLKRRYIIDVSLLIILVIVCIVFFTITRYDIKDLKLNPFLYGAKAVEKSTKGIVSCSCMLNKNNEQYTFSFNSKEMSELTGRRTYENYLSADDLMGDIDE